MSVAIAKSVGQGGANQPLDVMRIDELLRAIGLLGQISPTTETRNAAIRRFQEIWQLRDARGQYDGKIDPGGRTLATLNAAAVRPRITRLDAKKKIGKGGYRIAYTPAPPPAPYRVWLGVTTSIGDHFDITGRSPDDVIGRDNLPELLKLVVRHHRWGLQLALRVMFVLDDRVVLMSDPVSMSCPVAPHNGRLLPLDPANGGILTYQGDADANDFHGRWLQKVEGFPGYLFFAYLFDSTGDSNFETSDAHRGFDCITYAGTVCGAPPTVIGDTQKLLGHLNPAKCSCTKQVEAKKKGDPPVTVTVELENASREDLQAYFRTSSAGYHIMWSGGHVVLVADGTVHEFSAGKGGYAATPVLDWLGTHGKQSVRKLASKPAFAT